MKEFLTKKGLKFQVKDVHADAAAQDDMAEMGDGPCLHVIAIADFKGVLRFSQQRQYSVGHATLQAQLDSRFRGPTGAGATAIAGVAPTVILSEGRAVSTAPTAEDAQRGVVATWVGRSSVRYPALAEARGRLALAAVAGGIGFFVLFVVLLWVVGEVPGDDPIEAVLYSVPRELRNDLGLGSGSGWRGTVARQLFSVTAFLPGLAAGATGALAHRKRWPAWLGMLLAALAACLFLAPYLPPFGTAYRYDPFQLVAVAYLAAGAAAGRLGAWFDAALERR